MMNNYNLLIKDLLQRIPYGVKFKHKNDNPSILSEINFEYGIIEDDKHKQYELFDVKFYLFPLSSMTEEQKIECFKGTPLEIDKYGDIAVKDDIFGNSLYTDLEIYLEVIDWLNKNHFDYRGLINKGLAIDCTNLNIY